MSDESQQLVESLLALAPQQRKEILLRFLHELEPVQGVSTQASKVAEASMAYRFTDKPKGGVMEQLDRITQNPGMMGGKACIRGMRVTVGMIVSQIAAGLSIEDLLADYPYLEREDVTQALRYAAWRAEERELTLASQ